ncbi:hypothetical protein ACFSKU_17060 [Pontibacter silvestris]|uniref:LPS export ABC transporter periplasmic protein LptC n=1 Tax=Pontibacter silvestris TaxID=2305183 RepID=A0ABW4X1X7_9BACT|nr:hypothetical protein [Pontibacter silvestris]MCC9135734.1 hypothetical protein [Pontibacter silvestris]
MAKYKIILLFGLLWATTACERPAPPVSAKAETSYDLTSYLQEQEQRLQAEKPVVLKSVQTKGKPTETIKTRELNWESELSVFDEVDLNRPALRDYYTKQEQVLEDGSTLIKYSRTEDAEAPVSYLQLQLSPEKKLTHLEALIQDRNVLFYSKRRINLEANAVSGDISSYHISGVQKLVFGDSLRYLIDARL